MLSLILDIMGTLPEWIDEFTFLLGILLSDTKELQQLLESHPPASGSSHKMHWDEIVRLGWSWSWRIPTRQVSPFAFKQVACCFPRTGGGEAPSWQRPILEPNQCGACVTPGRSVSLYIHRSSAPVTSGGETPQGQVFQFKMRQKERKRSRNNPESETPEAGGISSSRQRRAAGAGAGAL